MVTLLKQGKPSATQDQVKQALKSTAKDIGPAGFDQHSGAGIIRAKAAYDVLAVPAVWKPWESLSGFCTDGVGVSSWGSGRLDCFVVGNDRQLWHKYLAVGGVVGKPWAGTSTRIQPRCHGDRTGSMRLPSVVITQCGTATGMAPPGNRWESLSGFCTDGVGVSSVGTRRLDCSWSATTGSSGTSVQRWVEQLGSLRREHLLESGRSLVGTESHRCVCHRW